MVLFYDILDEAVYPGHEARPSYQKLDPNCTIHALAKEWV